MLQRCTALAFLLSVTAIPLGAQETASKNVILVTIDGLRWQELFHGAERRLIDGESGGVRNPAQTMQRFWAESAEQRRQKLMPFFWNVIAKEGQVFGDPSRESPVHVTNGLFFSYPGYNEILSGSADPAIDSNDKRANPNVTVLEWLHQMPPYRGRVAAFASWDVFPFIINTQRSGIYVNAGWQALEHFRDRGEQERLNSLANELPHYWDNVRYDAFTFRAAVEYLHVQQPRVLYLALGETDDWAHAGRYDLYLDAARRTDDSLQRLWRAVQEHPKYANQTSFVVTTDHGRGDGRDGWKSHGTNYPGSDLIWIAAMGPDTAPRGVVRGVQATQSQVAATVAALLGEDFVSTSPKIGSVLPGVVKQEVSR